MSCEPTLIPSGPSALQDASPSAEDGSIDMPFGRATVTVLAGGVAGLVMPDACGTSRSKLRPDGLSARLVDGRELIVGAKLGGVLGAFFAAPILAVLGVVLERIYGHLAFHRVPETIPAPAAPDQRVMLELRKRFAPEVIRLGEYLHRYLFTLWGYDALE